jgi:hypothetical protein
MKYQVVYQGYESEPNQVVSEPMDFDDANWMACEMQAELAVEPDFQKGNEFFVVEPIFSGNLNDNGGTHG